MDVVIGALQQADEGGSRQLTGRDFLQLRQPVILRKDHHQRILGQGDDPRARRPRQGHKAHIHAALPEPLIHIVVVSAAHFQLRPGVLGLKPADHPRQPVDGHAGEHANADGSGVGVADFPDALGKLLLPAQNLPHFRQHQTAGLGQHNAAAASAHQAEAVFRLQIVQDVADPGLGGAQGLGGLGQTSQVYCPDECLIFFQAHVFPLFTMLNFHSFLFILSYIHLDGNCFFVNLPGQFLIAKRLDRDYNNSITNIA